MENTKKDDGGPAFPLPVDADIDCAGRAASGYGGISIRDYFIAHAPAEPQPWFQPTMRPRMEVPGWATDPKWGMTPDQARHAEKWRNDQDYLIDEEWAKPFQIAWNAYWDDGAAWNRERDAARYVQWPAAWADAMLKERRR